ARALEEADDLAFLGIRGHPVPGLRREVRRAGFDDGMEPLSQGPIWFRHRGDRRQRGPFVILAARLRLPFFGVRLRRGSFLGGPSLGRLSGRGGSLGGLLRGLVCAHRSLLYRLSQHVLLLDKATPSRATSCHRCHPRPTYGSP